MAASVRRGGGLDAVRARPEPVDSGDDDGVSVV